MCFTSLETAKLSSSGPSSLEKNVHVEWILRIGQLVILSAWVPWSWPPQAQWLHPFKSVLLRACRQTQRLLRLWEGCLRSQSFLHTPAESHNCFFFHLAEKSICVYREVESVAHGINICVCVCVWVRERETERERERAISSDMLNSMNS